MHVAHGPVAEGRARAEVVRLARLWIGTPYHHQASVVGAGVDCIGLVRGVWRALYGTEPERMPAYQADWAEATGEESLLDAARRHLVEVEADQAREGDVVVFRYRPRLAAKHAGILARQPSGSTLIHAIEGAPVTEVALSPWWQRRVAAAFSFPGVSD